MAQLAVLVLSVLLIAFAGLQEATAWHRALPITPARNIQLPLPKGLSYKTLYFDQQIDHLGFANGQKFKQRFLVADQFWNRDGGPIFFYTGNEGDITWFCNNTGFMWDIAPEFKAMLVFAEHRYYGESLPFGSQSFSNVSNLNYLTSEQALADFAELVRYLKATIPGAQDSPVVAFGGSYGGMLAAWFRIKYPNIVIGSLAASAPIWQFTALTPCRAFYDTTTATFAASSTTCVKQIRKGFSTLSDVASQVGGYEFISKTFGLCSPLKSKYDLDPFMSFLVDTYVNLAMADYPYPASFLADLPGWPVKEACSFLAVEQEGKALLEALAKVTNLFYNYTGQTPCVNWTVGSMSNVDYQGWNYQSCTEMVMPMCSNGSGMFYNMPWDFDEFSDSCYKMFKVRPRKDWIALEYWAKDLGASSNIIFSNGEYDPWSSGGVLESLSNTLVAIWVPRGAHHLDLRGSNPLDPVSIKEVRIQEQNIIREWLKLTP